MNYFGHVIYMVQTSVYYQNMAKLLTHPSIIMTFIKEPQVFLLSSDISWNLIDFYFSIFSYSYIDLVECIVWVSIFYILRVKD